MSVFQVQNDFSQGEFDPRLKGRFNLSLYQKGASKLRNVVVLSQGGVQRRFGSVQLSKIDITDTENLLLSDFQLKDDVSFILVFFDRQLRIFDEGGVILTTLLTPYPASVINGLRTNQTTNLRIITHEDFIPRELFVNPLNFTDWTLREFAFRQLPVHDFETAYLTSHFDLNQTGVGTQTLTVTSGPFVFTQAFVGGAFIGPGAANSNILGFSKILSLTNPTTVEVRVESEFRNDGGNTLSAAGDEVVIAEVAFSNLFGDGSGGRGWPKTVTFYQNRLYFGGSKSLPGTLFGGVVGQFNNFDIGRGFPSDAIIEQINTDEFASINHLVADKTLQIFTTNSEYSPPQLSDVPLTPGNASIRTQSRFGSTDVIPRVLDNTTFFVKHGGTGVMRFKFVYENQSYESTEISILSPQLIRKPVDSGVWKGAPRDTNDYLFIVNFDGTLAIYQSRQDQSISAWTLAETQGRYIRTSKVGDDFVSLVERFGTPYLEKFSFDELMDGVKKFSFAPKRAIITGLDDYENQVVQVRADGSFIGEFTVSGGRITLQEAFNEVSVGLGYNPLIETLPIVVPSQQGIIAFTPRAVSHVYVQFFESLEVTVNGVILAFREFATVIDKPDQPKTGTEEITLINWDKDPQISITQSAPLPLTLLTIGYEIEI